MSDYEYDIFISYRNVDGIREWVQQTFYKALNEELSPILPQPPRIFLDKHVRPGTGWTAAIQHALLRTKILIPVLAVPYDQSQWCLAELRTLIEREKILGRHLNHLPGLIIPVAYCKKHLLPAALTVWQIADFSKHAFPGEPFLGSTGYVEFQKAMKPFAETIRDILVNHVPDWDATWPLVKPAGVPAKSTVKAQIPAL